MVIIIFVNVCHPNARNQENLTTVRDNNIAKLARRGAYQPPERMEDTATYRSNPPEQYCDNSSGDIGPFWEDVSGRIFFASPGRVHALLAPTPIVNDKIGPDTPEPSQSRGAHRPGLPCPAPGSFPQRI